MTAAPVWDPNRSHMRVALRGVRTQAHVGLHAWERHPERPTALLVSVEMFAPTDGALGDTRAPVIDYDIVRNALRACLERLGADDDAESARLLQQEAVNLAGTASNLSVPLATIGARLRLLSDRVQRRFFTLLPEAHQLEDEEEVAATVK